MSNSKRANPNGEHSKRTKRAKRNENSSVNNDNQQSLWYYLRYKLNEDCLVEMFEYLDFHDLLRVCDLDTDDDQFFTELIRNRVIGRKLIVLWHRSKQVWSLEKTFQKFGPYIKRLKVPMQSDCLNYILKIIFKYGAPDTLTEVLFVKSPTDCYAEFKEPVSRRMIKQSVPYFSNVKHVIINIDSSFDCAMSSFYAIFLNSPNVKSLKIKDRVAEQLGQLKWVNLVKVKTLNVTELVVVTHFDGRNELVKFIKRLPHLEVFVWHGARSCLKVGKTLVKHCPKLKNYGDYCQDRSTDPNYYDFLTNFEHLTHATLTTNSQTAHDVKGTLQILAQKNQLRELTIYQSSADLLESTNDEPYFEFVNGFSSLKSICFRFYDGCGSSYSGPKDYTVREPFYRNLLTSMRELQKVTLIAKSSFPNMHKIFRFVPKIREINIVEHPLYQMPVEIRRIRKFCQQIANKRRENGTFEPIRLILNGEQAREFKVYKDNDQIIKIAIKDDRRYGLKYGSDSDSS